MNMNVNQKCAIVSLLSIYLVITGAHRDWWKQTTIYEVFIWSFKDSDGDGIGDIKGLTSMLDHFVDLEIETIRISLFQKSSMVNVDNDVDDFLGIDPMFGTMEDFEELLQEMKPRGLKLIMDFVLNHSGDKHPWFLKSIDKIEPYTDYYVWKDPNNYDSHGVPIPPNNWLSVDGTSAWKWNVKRKQFYYHVFNEKQPDFNLRHPKLVIELKNMIKFWLDKGVSGICLETPGVYMEDILFRNEPFPEWTKPNGSYLDLPDSYHKYTLNLNETFAFIHQIREFIDYHYDTTQKIVISGDHSSWKYTMKYYGTEDYDVVHFPLNFILTSVTPFPSAKDLHGMIRDWLKKMPAHGIANWQAENHYDESRIGSRLNSEYMDIMMILVMTLPGIASLYYGQEIGMMNIKLRLDQIQDVKWGRDGVRSPMQWDDSMNAGFSSNSKLWLPVNSNYWRVNVESEKNQRNSPYRLCSTLSSYRRTKTLQYGDFKPYLISPWIYAYTRRNDDYNDAKKITIIVVINTGSETEIMNLHTSIPYLPPYVKVIAASLNAGYVRGTKIYTKPKFPHSFIMRPASAVVLST